MPKTDISQVFTQIGVAFALLTRLPMPRLPDDAFAAQARAVWAIALVGVVVGAIAAVVAWASLGVGLPASVTAGLTLLVQIMISGAMHEDALADTADGLWGGTTPQRRLEIMKDSAIGAYGVLALILSLGLRWSALTVLLGHGPTMIFAVLITTATLSRATMPWVMTALPHARSNGLSHSVGRPTMTACVVSTALAVVVSLIGFGISAIVLIGLAVIGAVSVALIAKVKIGGQTGDILGACQQVAEISVLLGLLVVLA